MWWYALRVCVCVCLNGGRAEERGSCVQGNDRVVAKEKVYVYTYVCVCGTAAEGDVHVHLVCASSACMC